MDRPKVISRNKVIEIIIITLVVVGLTYVSVLAEPSQKKQQTEKPLEVKGYRFSQSNSHLEIQALK